VDREGLWFRLLAARYGLERGQLLAGGVRVRCCGRILLASGMVVVLRSWFPNNLQLHVGNGANTLFWVDKWVGDAPLSVRFRRLYDLCEDKLCTVAEMFAKGWEAGGEAWKAAESVGLGGGDVSRV